MNDLNVSLVNEVVNLAFLQELYVSSDRVYGLSST